MNGLRPAVIILSLMFALTSAARAARPLCERALLALPVFAKLAADQATSANNAQVFADRGLDPQALGRMRTDPVAWALGQTIGARGEDLVQTTRREQMMPGRLSRLFDQSPYAFEGRLDPQNLLIGEADFKNRQVKLFPAKFLAFPNGLTRMREPAQGVPRSADVFAMFVADADVTTVLQSGINPHVANALAYIRFHRLDRDVVITEIQSDVFDRLEGETRSRFEHWARVLLLAFENYVRETDLGDRLIIAGRDYQTQKWQKDGTDKSALFRILYRDLPKLMGYEPLSDLKLALEWRGMSDRREKISIGEGSVLKLDRNSPNRRFRAEFAAVFTGLRKNAFRRNYRTTLEALYALQFVDGDRIEASGDTQITGAVPVASSRLSLAAIPGLTSADLEIYQKLWQKEARRLAPEIQGSAATFLSLAQIHPEQQSFDDTAVPSDRARFDHLGGNDRHPRLTIAPPNRVQGSLGLKGAGARSTDVDRYRLTPSTTDAPFASFYRASEQDGREILTFTHRVWGGLRHSEAVAEFAHALALQRAVIETGFLPQALAALPLDVHRLDEALLYSQSGIERIPIKDYSQKYLGDGDGTLDGDPLTTYRSLTRSRFRVIQFIETLREQTFPGSEMRRVLIGFLRDAYAGWGRKLILPASDGLQNLDRPAQISEVQSFLQLVFETNAGVGKKIFDQIRRQSLITIATVHGRGGHLGGFSTSIVPTIDDGFTFLSVPVGAPKGGSTESRNMTLAGELTDLDANVYFPWIDDGRLTSEELRQQVWLLPGFQKADLQYWDASLYWLEILLTGRALQPKFEVMVHPFGDPESSGMLVIPYGYDYKAEEKFSRLDIQARGDAIRFRDRREQALYERVRKAGSVE